MFLKELTYMENTKNKLPWKKIWENACTIDNHYSAVPKQQEVMYNLIKNIKGVFVELGVAHGKTSYIMAQVAKENGGEFIGVDNFTLDSTEQEVRDNLTRLGVPFVLHPCKTSEAPWDINKKIDALFIDADHAPMGVKLDCERWIPFVKEGGLVFFHDWPLDPSVGLANPHWGIHVYGDEATKDWKHIDWVEGMEIRQKPFSE